MDQTGLRLLLFLFLCHAVAYAQLDSIQRLPEVVLTDFNLKHFSSGFKVETIADSIVSREPASLTDVLRQNSTIYFKENGKGMVASPSFRGTNAAQTAVVWNGININSIFTGQTDFNVISPLDYDGISVRGGGGSVQYGSGAVGGSIHLNNNFSFEDRSLTRLNLRKGSFSTWGGSMAFTESTSRAVHNWAVDFINSENNYAYVDKNKKNNHGEFTRFTAKANEALTWSWATITWNSEFSYSDRNFSGSLNTIGKDGYEDTHTRNLFQLHKLVGNTKLTVRAAHLFEQFRYFPDTERPQYTQGRAQTAIGGAEAVISLQKGMELSVKGDVTHVHAIGDNTGEHSRTTLAAVALFKHTLSKRMSYGLNVRQEFANEYANPLVFAVDAHYSFNSYYSLRINGSKNFRVPTFNDLYWYAGGNYDLKPETSYQFEVGNELTIGNLSLDMAAFFISSQNLIKWVPAQGSMWRPSNISKTQNFGIEAKANYKVIMAKDQNIDLQGLYSYTVAEDLERNLQLIYVPYHRANATINYNFKNISVYTQGLFTGEAFTTTDNSEVVDSSLIFDFGTEFKFQSKPEIIIGSQVKNVFNSYYENVAYRPMPSRNFIIFLNFNF